MHSRQRCIGQNGRRQRAFSLLELIIASALATTLLVLVWSLFSIYSKLEAKGSEIAVEFQLVRSLMQQLRSDLRRVIVTRDEPQIGGTSTSELRQLPLGGELVGSDRSLTFVVLATSSDCSTSTKLEVSPASESGEMPASSVFDVVSYVWRASEESSALPTTAPEDERLLGLTRRVIPWNTWQERRFAELTIDESSSEFASIASRTNESEGDRVPEVVDLRFRYSDGELWLDSWDSQIAGRLPVAVELTFELEPNRHNQVAVSQLSTQTEVANAAPNKDPANSQYSKNAAERSLEYRFVVMVDSSSHEHEQRFRGGLVELTR